MNPETKKQGGGGDIVTVDKYRNFELIIDFKYTKGANDGIKYFIDTEVNNGALASIGCRISILKTTGTIPMQKQVLTETVLFRRTL